MKIKSPKYKYNIINSLGREEPWTGVFKTIESCKQWYEKYGKEFEKEGRKLILIEMLPKTK